MTDLKNTSLYCKISASGIHGKYENISTTMTETYLIDCVKEIVSVISKYELCSNGKDLDVTDIARATIYRLGNIRKNYEGYRFTIDLFNDSEGFKKCLKTYAISVVGYPESWYEEFTTLTRGEQLHRFIGYSYKRNKTVVHMNFNYNKYLQLTSIQEELKECDADKARFYHDMTLLMMLLIELSTRSKFLITITEKDIKECLTYFKRLVSLIPVTGFKCWTYYHLEGCSADDVFYELNNLYSENKRFIPYIQCHNNKKIIRLKTRTNDSYARYYLNYLYDKKTPEQDNPSGVDIQTEISMGMGRTSNELAVSVEFTGMNIISRVLSTIASSSEKVKISNMRDYVGFSIVNLVSFYFKFILNSLTQSGTHKFSYLTAFADYIKSYKAKRNIPLNTLTVFALVQLPKEERLKIIYKYYSATREQEKNELIKDCDTLERKFRKVDKQEQQQPLYKQLLCYLENLYVW